MAASVVLTLVSTTLATATPQPLRDVAIYPVPALAGRFTVELGGPAAGATDVTVFNLLGQPVYQHQFGTTQTKLNVETGLGAGSYMVQVRREGGIFTQKVSVF